MICIPNATPQTQTAEEIAELILSLEAAKPKRIVIANAKSGEVAYPWDPSETPDYLARVLTVASGNRAWLEGSDVMLEFV